jgi:hypothetical protein
MGLSFHGKGSRLLEVTPCQSRKPAAHFLIVMEVPVLALRLGAEL